MFTTSLANIAPGAAITIEIEYQQTVQLRRRSVPAALSHGRRSALHPGRAGGRRRRLGPGARHRRRCPTPRASRRRSAAAHGRDQPGHASRRARPGVPLAAVRVLLSRDPHDARCGAIATRSRWPSRTVPADRDFELVWRPVAGAAPTAALLVEPQGDAMYALLDGDAAGGGAAERVGCRARSPSCSITPGSMAGASIDQAKAALKLALERLHARRHLQRHPLQPPHATVSSRRRSRPAGPTCGAAERYVAAIRARRRHRDAAGARARARRERGRRPAAAGHLPDRRRGGQRGRLFAAIRERLGDSRLFTIGIGSAPNSHFMREAARLGRGTFTYIGSPGEVQDKMVALFRKVESPAVADIALELAGGGDAEILPDADPRSLLRASRSWSRSGPARCRRSRRCAGARGRRAWDARGADPRGREGAGLSTHWARRKIAALLDQRSADGSRRCRAPGGARGRAAPSPREPLHEPGGRRRDAGAAGATPALTSHALATNLPHGWDYAAVIGAGQGATPAALHLVLGLTALLAAVVLGLCLRGAPALVVARRRAG